MQIHNEQGPPFANLDTAILTSVRNEIAKVCNMVYDTSPIAPEALPRLNFEAGQRSIVAEIDNEIRRRKEDASVF